MGRFKRWMKRAALLGGALFLLIQLVPYGRAHDNPPLRQGPVWDSPRTEALARRACFDCHSNETVWPWYSHVAPSSWLLQYDVEEGRKHLNLSEWDRPQRDADEAADEVAEGSMPPWTYTLTHPAARLSDPEKQELIAGLKATFGEDGGRGRGRGGDRSTGHAPDND